MNEPSANPVWVSLLCLARCLVPLLVLLGVSYVLRRLGAVAEPLEPPAEQSDDTKNNNGGLVHGSA
jgi:hypothetical protein